LNKCPDEWNRLYKQVLKKTKQELNLCVDKNVAPLFGYPPVPYSPPPTAAQCDLEKPGFGAFLDFIFTKNKNKSILKIMEAAREQTRK